MARCMLQLRNLIQWSVDNYKELIDQEYSLPEQSIFDSTSEVTWASPNQNRTPHSKKHLPLLHRILDGYSLGRMYNMDETGLLRKTSEFNEAGTLDQFSFNFHLIYSFS